jgi:7,8-dihydropterin-6-yl-methyl-4-(beta-D-ribofuranosyl)aminobenzene 5'-phosphate synthase
MAKKDIGEVDHLKITVLSEKGFYDSELFLKELAEYGGLQARQEDLHLTQGNIIGFATLVECNEHIYLVDTTGSWDVLQKALQVNGYDPEEIDGLFITHEHFDHLGGAVEFLKIRPGIDVWLPFTFSDAAKERLKEVADNVHEVASHRILPVIPGLAAAMMPGEFMLNINGELFLAANIHEKGLVLIIGCAHPGIDEMIDYARIRFKAPLFGIFGGFHISPFHQWNEEQDKLIEAIVDAELSFVAGNHCTGRLAVAKLNELLPDSFYPAEAGEVIVL